ncbi:MAG: hypothetical protein AMXMBFR4_20880 [Candidatus Hydrogenedentota bacterium]
MQEWYSGLVPYGPLLAAKLVIIAVYGRIGLEFSRGYGFFTRPRKAFGAGALTFGVVYLFSMVIRYGVRMALYPEERWFGGCIPIVFHWVLAFVLIAFALYHLARLREISNFERPYIDERMKSTRAS